VLIGGVIGGTLGYLIQRQRRGRIATVHIGRRRIELATSVPPTAAFDQIASIGFPYRVDDQDAERHMLVLASVARIWHEGFFYPVVIHPDADGSRIEIGVQAKLLFSIGYERGLARCARAVEAVLLPTARVTS
jgi:hypothetical protein